MNYTYIIECEDGTYYTGWTSDPIRRYQQHLNGEGAKYTKSHPPKKLIYVEEFENKVDAQKREWEIKHMAKAGKKGLVKLPINKADLFDVRKVREKAGMKELKVCRCNGCGKVIVVLEDSACPTKCCGEDMEVLQANTTDASEEKHVPVINRGETISVSVGSTLHPMDEDHYINFVILETAKGFRVAYLNPGDEPTVEFYGREPIIAVYAYCNLHGLWKVEA